MVRRIGDKELAEGRTLVKRAGSWAKSKSLKEPVKDAQSELDDAREQHCKPRHWPQIMAAVDAVEEVLGLEDMPEATIDRWGGPSTRLHRPLVDDLEQLLKPSSSSHCPGGMRCVGPQEVDDFEQPEAVKPDVGMRLSRRRRCALNMLDRALVAPLCQQRS